MALLVTSSPDLLQQHQPVQVLIAEDNEFSRIVLASQLQKIFDQHSVPLSMIAVDDGQNARRALCREEFDALSPTTSRRKHEGPHKFKVAFVDCQFPEVPDGKVEDRTGIAVTEDVRRTEETAKTPRHVHIIASSGDSDQSKFTKIFDEVIAKGSPIARIESALVDLGIFEL